MYLPLSMIRRQLLLIVALFPTALTAQSLPAASPECAKDCARCHEDGALDHATETIACNHCHALQGEISSSLPLSQREAICLECHAEQFEGARTTGSEELDSSGSTQARLHGPLEQGQCTSCHRLHDGPLHGQLPVGLYARYERSAYSACFDSCHEPEIVEEATTTTATRFRNGSDNLHFRHVAKQRRGRSCRLCHSAHQAPGLGLVRRGMPYGSEILTLEFTSTSSGGSCATSCHDTLDYDRTKAIPSRMRVE